MLTTNSETITFNSEFYDYFVILGGEINPVVNDNERVKNIDDYAIYINPDDIVKVEEQDDDSLFNTCIGNGRLYIRNIAHPDKPDIEIQAEGEKEMFLTEEALELTRKGKGLIYFKDLDDDTKLFEMVIMNQELTKPLYDLMDLLNKQKAEGEEYDINSISQRFFDLLIESRIDANVIAAELIINRLIRSATNIYERPDFSEDELEPYEIYTVSRALERNKSPLIGISFQNIKRQFLSDEFFENRNGTCFIDPFFWTKIPTENLKKYSKLAMEERKREKKFRKIRY